MRCSGVCRLHPSGLLLCGARRAGHAADQRIHLPTTGNLARLVYMGHTYELGLVYPVGFQVQPELMEIYGAVANNFSVAGQATATPRPTMVPLSDVLRDGPLIGEADAIASLRTVVGERVRVVQAQLLTEAAAAKLVDDAEELEAACAGPYGIPLRGDGFWALTVESENTGAAGVREYYLIDGKTGSVLCHIAATPTQPPYP